MNAHIQSSDSNLETDIFGEMLLEELGNEAGLDMIIDKVTHQEIRQGEFCQGKCIDHAYTNVPHLIKNINVQNIQGTHHNLLTMNLTKETKKLGPRQKRCRNRRKYSPESFQHELSLQNWRGKINRHLSCGQQIKQLEGLVDLMTNNILRAVDKIAPMRTINERRKVEPWKEDTEIKEQKEKEKNSWLRWKESPTEENKIRWEHEKNKMRMKITERKSFHIKKEISEADSSDTGDLWRALKRCINWNTSGAPRQLRKKDGTVETRTEGIAEILHETMQDKVLTIVKNVEKYEESVETEARLVTDLLGNRLIEEFNFEEKSEEDLQKIIKTLPRKTSTGIDNISYIELIDGVVYIVPILTEIINGIMRLGHWPVKWKTSIIKPLFKGGPDVLDPKSYRPISLTTAPSRVAERILNIQLQKHIDLNEIIPNDCHGFIPGKGTTTAALDLLNEMQLGIEDNEIPTMLGVDMSAAFDSVNRQKLLRLLQLYSVGRKGIKLFKSYFSGRQELVEVGAKQGKMKPSTVGVLQGSGLSPLFFLLYFIRGVRASRICLQCREEDSLPVEERRERCQKCVAAVCYADDLTATNRCKAFDRKKIEAKISAQGRIISNTIRRLQLAVNEGKSQFIAVMSSQRRQASRISTNEREEQLQRFKLNIDGAAVEETSSLRTSGIRFDERLNFCKHWEDLTSPVLKRIRSISMLKCHLSFLERKELGIGLVLSKLQYCLEITSCCPKYIFNKPKKLLNRLARVAAGEWDYERTAIAFTALGWLRFENLVVYRTFMLANKLLLRKDQPRILKSFATKIGEEWVVNEPNDSRTEIGRRSFPSRVKRLWSILPAETKAITLKSKKQKTHIKDLMRNVDVKWVLWGGERSTLDTAHETLNSTNRTTMDEFTRGDEDDNTDGGIPETGDECEINISENWTPEELLSLLMINEYESLVAKSETEVHKKSYDDVMIERKAPKDEAEHDLVSETGHGQLRQIVGHSLKMPLWLKNVEIGHSQSRQITDDLPKKPTGFNYFETGHRQLKQRVGNFLKRLSWLKDFETGNVSDLIKIPLWANYGTGHSQSRLGFVDLFKIIPRDINFATGHSQLRFKASNDLLKICLWDNYIETGHSQLRQRVNDIFKFLSWDEYIWTRRSRLRLRAGELLKMSSWNKVLPISGLLNFKYKRKLVNVI